MAIPTTTSNTPPHMSIDTPTCPTTAKVVAVATVTVPGIIFSKFFLYSTNYYPCIDFPYGHHHSLA